MAVQAETGRQPNFSDADFCNLPYRDVFASNMDLKAMLDDDDYASLRATFMRTGQGRRPDLPKHLLNVVTHKTLLQLYCLRDEGQKTWNDVADWMEKIVQPKTDARSRIRKLVESTWTKYGKLNPDEREDFLKIVIDLDIINDTLSALGIYRTNFSSPPETFLNLELKNGDIIKIMQACKECAILKKHALEWIVQLGSSTLNIQKLDYAVKKLLDKYAKILSSKHHDRNAATSFFESKFQPPLEVSESEPKKRKGKDQLDKPSKVFKPSCSYEDNQIRLEAAETSLREVSAESNSRQISLQRLQKENIDRDDQIHALRKAILLEKTKTKLLEKRVNRAKLELQATLKEMYNKMLEIKSLSGTVRDLEEKVGELKEKIKSTRAENNNLKTDISNLRQQTFEQQVLHDVQIKSGNNNAYADNIRQTVIQLQSEAKVSSENVEKVIRIVGKNVFDHVFPEKLPCAQSCMNMNVEGIVLSDIQTAEAILASKNVTLHTDGTSRDQIKYVNYQISCDNGVSFYLGFSSLATEDANSILDLTISLLKRLSGHYSDFSETDNDQIFQGFIRAITSTMTDRASTMKSFGKKLQQYLQTETGEQIFIKFLHCNAHFLLGLSTACDKAVSTIEKEEVSGRLGRDQDPQFQHFRTESETSTSRLVRLACDVLGPRGDQKNGRRADWIEFCPESLFPSFKSNRFNCYFEACAALIHHHEKMIIFFTSGILPDDVNLKLKSVGADILDDRLISIICAIAIMYVKVTAPYWTLLHSSVKYTEFHKYVKMLREGFERWSECPDDLILCDSVFGHEFSFASPTTNSLSNFLRSEKCKLSLVKQSLKAISLECLNTTERQLQDFITGDFSFEDPTVRETLSHCSLTNLIGESSFGDLDYDIRRRAHCTTLSRSATQSIKRNRTSKFLNSKSKQERTKLFSVARRKGRDLKKAFQEHETDVALKIKEKMVENQEKKIRKQLDTISKNSELLKRLEDQGGICKTANDVKTMFENFNREKKTKTQILNYFKDNIRFYKTIKGAKNINLKGSLDELMGMLTDYLDCQG